MNEGYTDSKYYPNQYEWSDMSLPEERIDAIPAETSQIVRKAFPQGHKYLQMRDVLGTIYTDDVFADLYPSDGQPAIRPWRLALVTVMQFSEELTDRQAAEAVRDRLTWKYGLSLSLTDTGFDHSVLCEFRQRLLNHDAAQRLLNVFLSHLSAKGWLKARGKQRTDSTHILSAVRRLNQLELVHETLRYALNELAIAAPDWLRNRVNPNWFEAYSQRTSNYLLPKKASDRQAWASQVGADGYYLLRHIYDNNCLPHLKDLMALQILRMVWIQHFYENDGEVCLRGKRDQPPPSQLITSPYDLDARCSTKRDTTWIGYKVHLTETCDDDLPLLITNVETRSATEPDHDATSIIHKHLVENGYVPHEHFVDRGYMSIDHVVSGQQTHIDLMGSVLDDNSWQARLNGYDSKTFTIDWQQQQATCPQGNISCSWSLACTPSQRPVVKIKFRHKDCVACEALDLCTKNREKRRTLTILAPQSLFEAQQQARERQETDAFKEACHVRAGVEGAISQLAHALNGRRSRYRGHRKTDLQHLAMATAMNLSRVLNWFHDVPRHKTPTSQFARLAA